VVRFASDNRNPTACIIKYPELIYFIAMAPLGLISPPILTDELKSVLDQTTHVPFYARNDWALAIKQNPTVLSKLPRLTKAELREHSPHNLLPTQFNLSQLVAQGIVEEESTSGTSGASVQVVFGSRWWAEQEMRALRNNSFIRKILDETPNARRAVLTTPGCSGVSCFARWLNYDQRIIGSTLYVNQSRIPFSIPDDKLALMAEETKQWQPSFLDVDPVHGMWFALYCERHGIRFPSLKFIISSYEFTSVLHRRIMERVFSVPVINLYGSSETGHLLIEQAVGEMIPSPETAFLELSNIDAQGIGQLLVTTRTNPYLPLLRYEIGDLAEIIPSGYRIHGRVRDALRRDDQSLISTYQIDQSFCDLSGVAHYQVRQSTDGNCEVLLLPEVPGESLNDVKVVVAERLSHLTGSPINIATVPLIPPEDSGKFRLTTRVA